jgi:hypothetical protein
MPTDCSMADWLHLVRKEWVRFDDDEDGELR